MVVIMNRILVADGPVKRISIVALMMFVVATENHDLFGLLWRQCSGDHFGTFNFPVASADAERVSDWVFAQVSRAQLDIASLIDRVNADPFVFAVC